MDKGAEENDVDGGGESGSRKDECRLEMSLERDSESQLPGIIDNIVELHDKGGRFSHIGPEPMPARSSVVEINKVIRSIYTQGIFLRQDSSTSTFHTIRAAGDRALTSFYQNRSPMPFVTIAVVLIFRARDVKREDRRRR